MEAQLPTSRSHVTLAFCTVLHAFTHAYASMLVPLYINMEADLKLGGVGPAALVVSLYAAVYCLGSYGAGVLADRFDRRVLLSIGLLGNAAAILGIGLCRSYPGILCLGMAAGAFGTLFHPSANALGPSHYPRMPGMAIGLLGIGSGLGFFFGPQIAGWRAHSATWNFWHVAQWQKPCVEMGLAGLIVGIIFLLVAHDPTPKNFSDPEKRSHMLGHLLHQRVMRIALSLMFRDFAGVAGLSLAAIYLRNVFHADAEHAGLYTGFIMLPSVIFSPLIVYLSAGRHRFRALRTLLIASGCVVITAPFWGASMIVPVLCTFQTLQICSYSVSDAAMLERVAPHQRGRAVGLFLVIAGTFGALGPWVMGFWTDRLGPRAGDPLAYVGPFALLSLSMLLATASPRFIGALGDPIIYAPISPLEEIVAETRGVVG